MNRGTVGFLMNEWRLDGLAERIAAAKAIRVAPLEMRATTVGGETFAHAGDQRSLAAARDPPDRQDRDFGQRPRRAARAGLRRRAGRDPGRLDRLQPLRARPDPAARLEAAGADPDQPVPPAPLAGAILPDDTAVCFRVLEPEKRPVSAVADQIEVRDVAQVEVRLDRERSLTLLFDPEHALDERIAMEQFAT